MRETTESKGKTGNVGNIQNSDAYRTLKVEPKDTDRQFTSNNQYYGIGDSAAEKQMLYDDKYNATINEVKDILLKERRPTKTSVKLFNEIDNTNVQFNKIECDQANNRQTPNHSNVMNQIPSVNTIQVTKDRAIYNNDNRINPEILSPLNNNPYSQPLNVF